MDNIVIRGARQHNLKGIDVVLPHRKFIVITGVSGSGKSSLAFDTLFAEGQRRYIEAISAHARQFLQTFNAPQVEEIEGLSPAIAIEQKAIARSPRSTVGTLTEIHDFLRLLFSRLGVPHCPSCGTRIRAYTVQQMVEEILEDWPEGTRLMVFSPFDTVGEKELPKIIKKLRRDGFARIRLNGHVMELDPLPLPPRRTSYQIDVIVDRLVLSGSIRQRLAESLELVAKLSDGQAGVIAVGRGEKLFSTSFRCADCGFEFSEITPSLFSFHHPAGTCPVCNGLGFLRDDVPVSVDRIEGENSSDASAGPDDAPETFHSTADLPLSREEHAVCTHCEGTRLNEIARSVLMGNMGIHQVSRMPVSEVRNWLLNLSLSPTQANIAERPRQEMIQRLNTLEELGLSYLTLDRAADTISGGEAQRIRIARQIGAHLSGVLYVLDEPSIGLHPRDHQRLLEILFRLRDEGNTLVVVEHDRQSIVEADYVVDIGPGAGEMGGQLIFAGPPKELLEHPTSLTALYISGRRQIGVPKRREPFSRGMIRIDGARGHNLKGITVEFPLACITCVTGVSGSGKSTLVLHTLYRALSARLYGSKARPAPFDLIEGVEAIQKLILVDQSPLGRTPRSTPATYTGAFALIRQIYSQLPEAKSRGYGPNRFSYNIKGGRCEACKGEGIQKIEMFFLPDVYVTCPICKGSRYNRETLEILFKGHSISEVLDMTVHEAADFFVNIPTIRRKLETLQEVGLGYLRLGQPATTLSGGESQRVKLASELSRKATGASLYILDEPTTGLHFDDIQKLLHVLQRLVEAGHTVIMVEHHLDVIKAADYVIDMGPEGGEKGGSVVAAGTPDEVARVASSHTGHYLRDALDENRNKPAA